MVKYPEDWKVVPLKEVYDIGSSKRVFQSQWRHSGIPFYRARDIVGFINGEEAVGDLFIDVSLYEEYKRAYGVPGIDDLLVTAVGTLGKVYRVTDHHPFYFKDGNIIWFKSTGKIDSCFVEQLFVSGHLDDQIYDTAGGSTVGTYTITSANKTQIPFPPLPEQKRIAAVLGNVDKLIDNLSRQIEKKRLIKQGAMQDLLTGKKRLPGFAGEWRQVIMGKIGSFYGGLSGKSSSDFNGGNAKYITFMNVLTNVVIDREQLGVVSVKPGESQNLVQKNDLFFNGSSETPEEVAMCAALLEDMSDTYLNSFCCGFRLSGAEHDPLFISYYFNSPQGRESVKNCAQGLTRYNLSKQTFLQTVVNWPTLAEQKAIAKVLGDMDAEIAKLEAKHEKYRQLKQGLMNDLLTGKVRI